MVLYGTVWYSTVQYGTAGQGTPAPNKLITAHGLMMLGLQTPKIGSNILLQIQCSLTQIICTLFINNILVHT